MSLRRNKNRFEIPTRDSLGQDMGLDRACIDDHESWDHLCPRQSIFVVIWSLKMSKKALKLKKKNIDRKPVRPKDAKTERPKTETRKEGGRGLGRHGRAGGLR